MHGHDQRESCCRRRRGLLDWGTSGAGKTHFLNYLLALEERAATAQGRCAIVRLGLEAGAGAYDLEQRMFDLLAREIGAGDAGAIPLQEARSPICWTGLPQEPTA
jgi:hypothetical protein